MTNKCDCYKTTKRNRHTLHITAIPVEYEVEVGICNGTRERDECSCGGDRTKCDFYPEVRARAKKEINKTEVLAENKRIKENLKYYLNTNEENGVVYIPKFIVEKMVYGNNIF